MDTLAYDLVSVEVLKPDPLNPRSISAKALAQLEGSICEFGLVEPLVVRQSDKLVIGGHQRLRAAINQGWKSVPVFWWEGSDAQARALNLALNKISGDWDERPLAHVLAELAQVESLGQALLGFDQTLTSLAGFTEREVLEALEGALGSPAGQEDLSSFAAALHAPPQRINSVEAGDLYRLGPHRVLCGDAADPDAIARLCGAVKPEMLFTDPPYNVHYSAESGGTRPASSGRTGGRRKRPLGEILNDALPAETYVDLITSALGNAAAHMEPGSAVYICGGSSTTSTYDKAFEFVGIVKSSILIWDKGEITLGRKDYQSQYELIYYGWIGGKRHHYFGGRAQSDIWAIPRDASALYVHPTQKPVALAARAIHNSTSAGGTVLDLFGGSGSTLIAAEQQGRRACILELDPHYVAVMMARWEALTGLIAEKLDGGG
ncbi:MAG: DNA modification methylase [Thermomicrobiales bacterium]